ncbi:MAG: phospholipid carrier-dependent glycosyltransferase [Defluviitaleaceae bacterium]|nr:phospholipid carrier-dependent glycosyltransferase [Defluviitaleaceae bacterium]
MRLLVFHLSISVHEIQGHINDLNTFTSWAQTLWGGGLRDFYANPGWTDYLPGYMYVLYVIGGLAEFFGVEPGGAGYNFLLKLPAILADLGIGVLLYKIALSKPLKTALSPVFIASLFVFNPIPIMLSTVWGQVDSVFGVFLLWSLYMLSRERDMEAYLLLAVSILIKPLALMFGPVYIAIFILRIWKAGVGRKVRAFLYQFSYITCAAAFIVAAYLPFMTWPMAESAAVRQTIESLTNRYPFTALNAYNVYTMAGLNWADIGGTFLGIGYEVWNVLALAAAAAVGVFLVLKNKSAWSVYIAAALICTIVFTFGARMHERYSFPMFFLLIAAYALRGDKRLVLVWLGMTVVGFVNMFQVLEASHSNSFWLFAPHTRVLAGLWVSLAVALFVITYLNYKKNARFKDFMPVAIAEANDIRENINPRRISKVDWIIMATITVVYTAVAFYRLGDRDVPQTVWAPQAGEAVVFDFGEAVSVADMWWFNGAREGRLVNGINLGQIFILETSIDNEYFEYVTEQGDGGAEVRMRFFNVRDVFRWHNAFITAEIPFRYVRLTPITSDMRLMEVAFRAFDWDAYNQIWQTRQMDVIMLTPGGEALVDEKHLLPEQSTFMNSTYFDEIFHPRTAYEKIHGLEIFEISHPPLGKVIMSWGVRLFGMTPFGWRVMGTIAGVLMVPLMYVFAKLMFKRTYTAFFVTFLFAFDFMHFTQTRLATIDSYLVLFIILSYLFMYRYYISAVSDDFDNANIKKTLPPLFFSGLFMGAAVAVKWSGLYSALGLAVIFAVVMFQRYRVDRVTFRKFFIKSALWCGLFFVVVPLVIYILSYLPQWGNSGSLSAFFTAVWENQRFMLRYHGYYVLGAEHPFTSMWWEWPLMLRPIWYYAGIMADGMRVGISAFGNPVLWWGGIPAFFYIVVKFIRTKEKTALFIILGYLAQFLPWMYISRILFIYHYFPAVPFVALMMGYCLHDLCRRHRAAGIAAGVTVAVLAGILFVLFYPVISGYPISLESAERLRWLPRWVLVLN